MLDGGVARRLADALSVRPGEGRRTALLFTHLLLASAIFILGRTVRDTLFLSRYELSALPWMFVLYGVASAITVVIYATVADKLPRHRLIQISLAVGAATYLGTWILVRLSQDWVYPVFYVWSEVAANLFIVQFWTLSNDLHDPRAARRLVPLIGAARILGVVLIGLLAGTIVRLIGTEQLLFVLIGMMAVMGVIAARLGREPLADSGSRPKRRSRAPKIAKDPYVRILSVFILLAFTALTIGDYQFKAIARATYQEDDLAAYFSLFYAGTGIVSFLFQLLLTPRILRRFGVGAGMSVMPAVFGAASAVMPFIPHLGVATLLKFSDNGFQYTIHETTLQTLYAPFAPEVKARTRAVLDAVVKPLSYGLGGLVLVVLAPRMAVEMLSIVTVGLVVAWLVLVPIVRRRYLRTLEATLSARGQLALEPGSMTDSEGRAALLRTITTAQPRVALLALEQLAPTELAPAEVPTVREAVERLARDATPAGRVLALVRLAEFPGASAEPARNALQHEEPELRAAAVRALAALAGDEAVDEVRAKLEDESQQVRVSALIGLLQHGGVDGLLAAVPVLDRQIASLQTGDRVEAAKVLRRMGPDAVQPLQRLLADAHPKVRRAALKAACTGADARFVPILVKALGDSRTRRRAAVALVAVGAPAIEPLIELLDDKATPRPIRLELPRILRRIPSEAAYTHLESLSRTTDGHLRLRILTGLGRLRERLGRPPEPLSYIHARIEDELREAYRRAAAWQNARTDYDSPIVREEMQLRDQRVTRRILRILELRFDRRTLKLVRRSMDRTERRANAIEVLDTLLPPTLRLLLLPYLDDVPMEQKLDNARPLVGDVPAAEAFFIEQCGHGNPFVVVVALTALARVPSAGSLRVAETALAHDDPRVREAAVDLIANHPDAEATALIEPLARDEDPIVAKRTQLLVSALATGTLEEVAMHTTMEKILFLKSATVFARVPAEDLAPLAHIAEETSYQPGDVLCAEGDVGDDLYILVSGRVRVERGGEALAELGPGDAVGEMAVLDAEPRSATVVAVEETEALIIGSEEFYEILHEQSEIAEGVIRLLTSRLRQANVTDQQDSLRPPNGRTARLSEGW